MNFRSRRRAGVNLDITPLIDVVFLLLIFFMVSTTFEHDSEINITLPTASREAAEPRPEAIDVALDADGNVYINDNALVNAQLQTIRTALSDALAGLDDPPVTISADAETPHQSVIRIMDAARQLGLARITFATRELDEDQ